jgi:hypothetical protein
VSKNVLILEWSHPAETVRSLASSLARGLVANGFSVTTVDLTKRRHVAKLESADKDAFSYIFSPGCVGFLVKVRDMQIYEYFSAKFYFWVLDPIIYDLARFPEVWAFFKQARNSDRLYFLFPDRSYQALAQEIVGDKCAYFPFAGDFRPYRAAPMSRDDASPKSSSIVLLANVGQELSEFASLSCREIVGRMDPFGLDAHRKASLVDHVQHEGTHSNVMTAVRNFMNLQFRELFNQGIIRFLSAIDASEKRRRRLMAVDSVRSMKIDIFGFGWQQHFGDCANFTFYPTNIRHDCLPDIFARYAVLLDFAPNWDHGFNDRVITSLGAGCRVVTTRNQAVPELGAAAELVACYSAHHPAPVAELAAALHAAPIETGLASAVRNGQDWQTRTRFLLDDET